MTTPAEISDLVHRYCDAVVHKDRHAWASTWAEDSRWDLGVGRLVSGKQAITDYWVSAMERFEMVVQLAHNGQATIADDARTGSGRWYISEHLHRVDGSTGLFLAYYDDTTSGRRSVVVRQPGDHRAVPRRAISVGRSRR